MDVMGGVRLSDGRELKIVSGIDDHSRFCVSAKLVSRATARPVCEALVAALERHGAPEQILTDNGKVSRGRFGPATGSCSSTASAVSTTCATCSRRPAARPPPARSSASTAP